MRKEPNMVIENYRQAGPYGTNTGHFLVSKGDNPEALFCVVSDGMDWDHVSVSVRTNSGYRQIERCPTWEEMCAIRHLFFRDDEVVMQLHPRSEENISFNDWVLHLWRPKTQEIPLPNTIMVGPK